MERRTFLEMAAIAIPVSALAQDGTLASSVTSTKLKISYFAVASPPTGAASASIGISVQTAGGVETGSKSVSVPGTVGTATVAGLIGAMMTVRATETGSNAQKMSFRVLGYLFDQGAIPEVNAVNP